MTEHARDLANFAVYGPGFLALSVAGTGLWLYLTGVWTWTLIAQG